MYSELQQLTQALKTAGVLKNNLTESNTNTLTPWYIKVLHGFSGWIASIFLLFALGAVFHSLFDAKILLIVAGLVLVGIAYLILKNQDDNVFVEQFAVAISLAGQAMVTFGLLNLLGKSLTGSYTSPWYILAIFEAALIVIMPNYLHRFVSAFVFASAFMSATFIDGFGAIGVSVILGITVWVWLSEFQQSKWISTKQPVGYGLSLGLVTHGWLDTIPFYYTADHSGFHLFGQHWVSVAISTTILLYIVWRLTDSSKSTIKVMTIVFALLIGLASLQAVGLGLGIILLIVAFSRGNSVLMGIGVAQLIWTIGRFYYTLDATLLIKSLYLISTGFILLIIYFLFRYFADNDSIQKGIS